MIYPSRILWVHARRTHTQFMCLIDLVGYNHPTIKTPRHTSNTPHHTHNTTLTHRYPTPYTSNSHQIAMVTPTNPNLIYTNAYIYIYTTTIQYITAHPIPMSPIYAHAPIPTTSSMQPHHLSTHIIYAQTPISKHPQCRSHPL